MNDDREKIDPDTRDDSNVSDDSQQTPHAQSEDVQPQGISEPIEGNPADDARRLADADPSGLRVHAGEESEEVLDTSADAEAAEAALDDAERMLRDQTSSELGPEDSPVADEVETAASDDTVTEDGVPLTGGSPEEEAVVGTDQPADDEQEDGEAGSAVAAPSGPIELDVPEDEEISLDWYILKVQSNRERSIAQALERKIAIEGLDRYFGEVRVPTEKVTEFKGGKKKIVERKLWPGYIAVQMHVNDDTWFAIRETSGIGDFTGSAGKPTPMQPSEVALILHTEEEETDETPKLDIKFTPGDKVKVMEGNFENFEGEVSTIDETHGRVTVMLSIFGRPTPVELEYWQVETV